MRRRKPFGLYPVTGYAPNPYGRKPRELRLPPERGPLHADPPAARYRVTVSGTTFVALFTEEPPDWYLSALGRLHEGRLTTSKKAPKPMVEEVTP